MLCENSAAHAYGRYTSCLFVLCTNDPSIPTFESAHNRVIEQYFPVVLFVLKAKLGIGLIQ